MRLTLAHRASLDQASIGEPIDILRECQLNAFLRNFRLVKYLVNVELDFTLLEYLTERLGALC